LEVFDAGNIIIKSNQTIGLYDLGTTFGIGVQPGGNVVINNLLGPSIIYLGVAGGAHITIGTGFSNIVMVAPGGVVVPYIDGTGGSWGGPGVPPDYNTAIDRLAVELASAVGHTIG